MNWKNLIAGCFGCEDCKFAFHTQDREHAAKLLAAVLEEGVGFKEYCDAVECVLREKCQKKWISRDAIEKHVIGQMKAVRDLSSYFVND